MATPDRTPSAGPLPIPVTPTAEVLGLDLSVLGTQLRFLIGEAELPGTARLLEQLQTMAFNVEARTEKAEAAAAEAEAAAAEARTDAARARVRGVLAVLQARGLFVSDAARARILAEEDTVCLDRWLEKAIVAASVDEVLHEG